MKNLSHYIEYVLEEIKYFSKKDKIALEAEKFLQWYTIDNILCHLCLSPNEKNIDKAINIQSFFKDKLYEFRLNNIKQNNL